MIQEIMFEVFEYAKIMDGFDSLSGEERTARRAQAQEQDAKIRKMVSELAAPSSTSAEPVHSATDREGIVARLRRVAKLLNLQDAIPEKDATLYGCTFSVLGMVALELERRATSAEDVRRDAAQIGPVEVVERRQTCQGCPALHTKKWRESVDGEWDSGTSADCTAAAGKSISAYWTERDGVPAWCPAAIAEDVRRDAELSPQDTECLAIGQQIQRAASELPDGWDIEVRVERDSGGAVLHDSYGDEIEYATDHDCLSGEIRDAIDAAIAAAPEAKGGQQ